MNEKDFQRAEELSLILREAQEAYYNLQPKISDQEYDALADELKRLRPEDPAIKNVGAPTTQLSVWEKVPHEIPMGSLDKVNSEKEFLEWANKTQAELYFITHKIDGSSMELVYKAGDLVKCVTRGDGLIGEDVTVNVSQVLSIPKKLSIPIDAVIRGEIVMFKDVFQEKYAEEYANPRNTAAGKVRDKKGGGKDCKNLEFLAYWAKIPDQPKTLFYMKMWLEQHGFQTPKSSAGRLDLMVNEFNHAVKIRNDIPYEIDGMVISINNIEELEELGDLNMRPKGQIAWKFDAAMGITRVNDIKWQNGSSGRITCVASVDPVNIGGVTITSVSLHNLKIFKDLRLFPKCRVLVSRRNDVIPYVEKNLDNES